MVFARSRIERRATQKVRLVRVSRSCVYSNGRLSDQHEWKRVARTSWIACDQGFTQRVLSRESSLEGLFVKVPSEKRPRLAMVDLVDEDGFNICHEP